jgi:hypothetical protein
LDQRLEEFSEVLRHVEGSRLHSFLTAAFNATFETQKESAVRTESSTCITRQVQNSDDYFHKLCQLAPARHWLERSLHQNKTVFLVVGIKTLTDATVRQIESRLRKTSVDFKVPVAAAVAAAGIPLPGLGDLADPGGGRSKTQNVDAEGGFFAPGEQVYAVQYRKVEFGIFSRRHVDNSWLESGNRWKVYVGSRGSETEGENDCIEASLSDIQQSQLAGVEGDGKCESLEVDGEELLYFWD